MLRLVIRYKAQKKHNFWALSIIQFSVIIAVVDF